MPDLEKAKVQSFKQHHPLAFQCSDCKLSAPQNGTLSGYPAYNFSCIEPFCGGTGGAGGYLSYFETGTVANGKIYTITVQADEGGEEGETGVYKKYWPEAKDILASLKIVR